VSDRLHVREYLRWERKFTFRFERRSARQQRTRKRDALRGEGTCTSSIHELTFHAPSNLSEGAHQRVHFGPCLPCITFLLDIDDDLVAIESHMRPCRHPILLPDGLHSIAGQRQSRRMRHCSELRSPSAGSRPKQGRRRAAMLPPWVGWRQRAEVEG